MNAFFDSARRRAIPDRATQRRFGRELAVLLMLAAPAVAVAQTADEAPWVVDGSTYIPDPGYNSGLYGADAFAGSESYSYRAKKLVRLDNGDIIVAAIVPAGSGSNGNAVNLGLVRYDAAGHRVAWTNPPPLNAFFGDQYIVYPNVNDANNQDTVSDVKDMRRIGDRIFILIDHPFAGTADMDARVLVFGTDGHFISTNSITTTTAAEYGGGIAVASNLMLPETITLAYAGTTVVADGTERPTYRRFTVEADGSLSPLTDIVYVTAGNYCDSTHDCELHGIAAGGSPIGAPTRYYLVGGRQYLGDDWDYLVFAVLPSGAPATSFSGDGAEFYAFDDGGNDHDVANTVYASRGILDDSVYLAGEVARDCKPGVGVVKIDGDGNRVGDFGSGGETIVGGSTTAAPTCGIQSALGSARADYALASTLDSGKLAIVGLNVYGPGVLCPVGNPCPEDNVDGELVVLDSASGAVDSFRGYAFSDAPGGPRTRHTGLWGIVGDGAGKFTAAGDARYFQNAPGDPAGPMQVATIRLMNGGGDSIFADGFDG
ncbi:MAG TPA: hypothetical protein VHE32_10460 [Rhodanobacteraceae bacterium]|nr:hypothetical protein [Rhodanobacteraceae bacterium]